MKEVKELKLCEACKNNGMKILIRRRDVMCQWHWQLLSPELRQEVTWSNKNDPPTLKSDWYDRALKFLKTSKDIFVYHAPKHNDDFLINALSIMMVLLVIVLAAYATLTLVK